MFLCCLRGNRKESLALGDLPGRSRKRLRVFAMEASDPLPNGTRFSDQEEYFSHCQLTLCSAAGLTGEVIADWKIHIDNQEAICAGAKLLRRNFQGFRIWTAGFRQ